MLVGNPQAVGAVKGRYWRLSWRGTEAAGWEVTQSRSHSQESGGSGPRLSSAWAAAADSA